MGMRLRFALELLAFCAVAAPPGHAAVVICSASAGPLTVRAEGIAERVGDLILGCTGGSAAQQITVNATVFLSVPITNRVSANGNVTDVVFLEDNGSGPQPVNATGVLTNNSLVFNGVALTLAADGSLSLRITNVRGNASTVPASANPQIVASVAFNGPNVFFVPASSLVVGIPETSLYATLTNKLVAAQFGSGLPATVNFSSLLSSNALFTTTRVTEGFASAFQPRRDSANLNGDSGERFVLTYSNLPAGSQVFAPNAVAGSDATAPTAGGDLGTPAFGGAYTPGATGSLLLALVPNADANGAGGSPIYTPGAPGSGTVNFDTVSPVVVQKGTATVTYEVVDANDFALESAQIPVFFGLTPYTGGGTVETQAAVALGPVSTVIAADATAPIPRFTGATPPPDCTKLQDCQASYFPSLFTDQGALAFNAVQGARADLQYVRVNNHGGGLLSWTVGVTYTGAGAGWLMASPGSGFNNATLTVNATAAALAPGTYTAVITIDAGAAGARKIPVTLTVVVGPMITAVTNAATFAAGPLAAGSLASIFGVDLAGQKVAVTFSGIVANILAGNATQINVEVPAALGTLPSAQVVVTVDGKTSGMQMVTLAPFAPGIFTGGVLNQDGTRNSASAPALAGSVLQIFATGLSGSGTISVQLAGRTITNLEYAGAAPGLAGVQQVNVQVPTDLLPMTTSVAVCGASSGGQPVCSPAAPLVIGR